MTMGSSWMLVTLAAVPEEGGGLSVITTVADDNCVIGGGEGERRVLAFRADRAESGVVLPPHLASRILRIESEQGVSLDFRMRPVSRAQAFSKMLISDALGVARLGWTLLFKAAGRRADKGALIWSWYQAALLHSPDAGSRFSVGVLASSQPGEGVRQRAGGGWAGSSSDPHFWLAPRGGSVRPGWYFFSCQLTVLRRGSIRSKLYPDFGAGLYEGHAIALSYDRASAQVTGLFALAGEAAGFRFDPLDYQADFLMEQPRLVRVSKPRALWILLGGGAERDFFSRLRHLCVFVGQARRTGITAAVDSLRFGTASVDSKARYTEWVMRFDEDIDRESVLGVPVQDNEIEVGSPLFSVLVPVYNTNEVWLRACLDSVLSQDFQDFELCLVDDASPAPHIQAVLAEYAQRDVRVRVHTRVENGHISRASQDALEMACGRFVALLDHDDELRAGALAVVASALRRNPQVKFLYSDEDKLDADGRRFHPNFKPDWNPDLLLSQNYICHLAVIERELMLEVGGFRRGYEGSQDHDLFLRCTAGLEAIQIRHIPVVLYHWRAVEGSTALVRSAKDYAADAGVRAVRDHLSRQGMRAEVEMLPHGHYRVRWGLGDIAPKVSLIVPTRDRADLLRMCVFSLLEKTDYPNFEIVVVDNQSVEPATFELFSELEALERVRVLHYDAPFNYSAINNWAAAQCDGELIGLVNNDIEAISGEWLREMASNAVRPGVGAVGAMLYYPDDRIQHAGVILGVHGVASHIYCGSPRGHAGHGGRALVAQSLSAVTAACLLVRREVFEEVGGLDEGLQVAFNDIDFCLRLRAAGYRNVWTPFAELYHHESASRGKEDTDEKKARFDREVEFMKLRWGTALLEDPAYNPNLSLLSLNCEFAFPPRWDGPA